MKKLLISLGLLATLSVSFSADAHSFYPMSMVNYRGLNSTLINMYLRSDESSDYAFSADDHVLRDDKGNVVHMAVIGGIKAIFPINVSNKYIVNNHIKLCSWPLNQNVQFVTEVCFNVKV